MDEITLRKEWLEMQNGLESERSSETWIGLILPSVGLEFETRKGYRLKLLKTKTRKKWRAQGDDSRTFLGDFVAALPQIEFPPGLNL